MCGNLAILYVGLWPLSFYPYRNITVLYSVFLMIIINHARFCPWLLSYVGLKALSFYICGNIAIVVLYFYRDRNKLRCFFFSIIAIIILYFLKNYHVFLSWSLQITLFYVGITAIFILYLWEYCHFHFIFLLWSV